MFRTFFSLLLILFSTVVFSQNIKKDTTYFDINWITVSKDKAEYYRPLPLKQKDDLVYIKDYYANGTLQMEGWVHEDNERKYEGSITWYNKNGKPNITRTYVNGKRNGLLVNYYENGNKKDATFYVDGVKNGKETHYYENGNIAWEGSYLSYQKTGVYKYYNKKGIVVSEITYHEGRPTNGTDECHRTYKDTLLQKQEHYYVNSNQIAYSTEYLPTYESVLKFYRKDGSLIDSMSTKDRDYIDVSYHLGAKCGTVAHIRRIKTYKDRKAVGLEQYYTKEGVLLYDGINKDGAPYSGSILKSIGFSIQLAANYVSGKKEGKAHFYNYRMEEIASGIYKNDKPYSGRFIEVVKDYSKKYNRVYKFTEYKNGIANGNIALYDDLIGNYKIETYRVVNNIVEGQRIWYDNNQEVATAFYKNGKPINGLVREKSGFSSYKDGKLSGEQIIQFDDNIEKQLFYENGFATKQVVSGIRTKTDRLIYGDYKKGKPYNGYFLKKLDETKILLLDYYKKGKLLKQFSKKDLEKRKDYGASFTVFDRETSYKNGKIVNGFAYSSKNEFLLVTAVKNKIADTTNIFLLDYDRPRLKYQLVKTENGFIFSPFKSYTRIEKNNKEFKYFMNDSLFMTSKTAKLKAFNMGKCFYDIEGFLKEQPVVETFLMNDQKLTRKLIRQLELSNYIRYTNMVKENATYDQLLEDVEAFSKKKNYRLLNFKFDYDTSSLIGLQAYTRDNKSTILVGISITEKEKDLYEVGFYKSEKDKSLNPIKETLHLNEIKGRFNYHYNNMLPNLIKRVGNLKK